MLALLKLWGHRTHAAEDGPSGVRRALEHKPEVALVDIGLPGVDGYELARRLKGNPQLASTRLVAHTGYGSPEDRRKALEAGFDAHLVKPAELEDLEKALQG
jgi:CheY-like chemotaxis protein